MKKRFCHECGSPATPDATFCEECGATLRLILPDTPTIHTAPAQPATTATEPIAPPIQRRPSSRVVIIAGAALTVAVAGGVAAWFLLGPKSANEAELRTATEVWIKSPEMQHRDRPCIQNFNYRAKTADITPNDSRSQEWLDPLVRAGIYTQPIAIDTGNPWQPSLLRYEKGPEAERFVINGKLCAASQLAVLRVNFDPKTETEIGSTRIQRGSVDIAWQDRAAWSQEAPLKEAFDSRFAERKLDVIWLRDKDKGVWRIGSPAELANVNREFSRQSANGTSAARETGGFSLGKFFSGMFGSELSAEQTAESFMRNMLEGNSEEAASLLDTGAVPAEKLIPLIAMASMEATEKGGVQAIRSEDLGGNNQHRRVRIDVTYKNGKTASEVLNLNKTDRRWLVALGN
jgi:hypothetical protein